MFCTNCGKSLEGVNGKFCPYCGAADGAIPPAVAVIEDVKIKPKGDKVFWVAAIIVFAVLAIFVFNEFSNSGGGHAYIGQYQSEAPIQAAQVLSGPMSSLEGSWRNFDGSAIRIVEFCTRNMRFGFTLVDTLTGYRIERCDPFERLQGRGRLLLNTGGNAPTFVDYELGSGVLMLNNISFSRN